MFYQAAATSASGPLVREHEALMAFLETHTVTHVVGCHIEISRTGEDYPTASRTADEAPWQLTVEELRHAYEVAKTITKPASTSPQRLPLQPNPRHHHSRQEPLRLRLRATSLAISGPLYLFNGAQKCFT